MIYVEFKDPILIPTDGSGHWSSHCTEVDVTGMVVNERSKSLIVYFDTASWDREKHGLIYTDISFLENLRVLLKKMGLPDGEIVYSEQGAQGEHFVDFDVSDEFVSQWRKLGAPTLESDSECDGDVELVISFDGPDGGMRFPGP